MRPFASFCLVSVPLVFATLPATAATVVIDTVPVGNAGNGGELSGPVAGGTGVDALVGGVSYDYLIGACEVTNSQYVGLLNAVDATGANPLGLYNADMASEALGGIVYLPGSPDGGKYITKPGREDMPVNYVSWYDAIRFANWLHNGQGSSDTEVGAYTIEGGTPEPSNGLSITRNADAEWFLPNENEWYKAAYHKNDGVTSNYFDYPTSSDTTPTAETPPGGSNSANYNYAVGDATEVGAYTNSNSPYGTFDQGGNLYEWNETIISGTNRGTRGGRWASFSGPNPLWAAVRGSGALPAGESSTRGFRVASLPEPNPLGDANGDGHVNGLDYLIWAAHFGETEPPELTVAEGDFLDDGAIDGIDYLLWASNFGQGPNDATPAPEPSACVLLLLGLGVIVARRRRLCGAIA